MFSREFSLLSLIDWLRLSVLPGTSALFALDVIDFVALTLVQPSVTIMGSSDWENKHTSRAGKVPHISHIAPNYSNRHSVTNLAIIKLTLSPIAASSGGGQGVGFLSCAARYASKDVQSLPDMSICMPCRVPVRELEPKSQRQLGLTRVPHVQLKCQWLAIFDGTWHVSRPSRHG